MIGRTIFHYRILHLLGRGGMGDVYLAQDLSLDRQVALKFLSEELQQDEPARKRFLREAKSVAALDPLLFARSTRPANSRASPSSRWNTCGEKL